MLILFVGCDLYRAPVSGCAALAVVSLCSTRALQLWHEAPSPASASLILITGAKARAKKKKLKNRTAACVGEEVCRASRSGQVSSGGPSTPTHHARAARGTRRERPPVLCICPLRRPTEQATKRPAGRQDKTPTDRPTGTAAGEEGAGRLSESLPSPPLLIIFLPSMPSADPWPLSLLPAAGPRCHASAKVQVRKAPVP